MFNTHSSERILEFTCQAVKGPIISLKCIFVSRHQSLRLLDWAVKCFQDNAVVRQYSIVTTQLWAAIPQPVSFWVCVCMCVAYRWLIALQMTTMFFFFCCLSVRSSFCCLCPSYDSLFSPSCTSLCYHLPTMLSFCRCNKLKTLHNIMPRHAKNTHTETKQRGHSHILSLPFICSSQRESWPPAAHCAAEA